MNSPVKDICAQQRKEDDMDRLHKLHRTMQEFFRGGDLLLLLLCTITTIYGIVLVASATNYTGSPRFVIIQCIALLLGIALYIFFSTVDIDIFAERRDLLFIFNLVFLLLLIPFGVEGTTGNRSWISFPLLPFNIQPAEICKITFIIILAKTMDINQNRLSTVPSVGRMAFHLVFLVLAILVLSKDAGVALVYVFIFLVMAFVGGVKLWWFLGGLLATAAAAPLAWKYVMRTDQKNRIAMLFDPTIDPAGSSVRWHTKQSLFSMQNGGLTGQGLFHGTRTQSGALNAQHTDFIFSAIGEELGMLGCLLTLLLLTAIIIRCVYVGFKSRNYMNRLVCIGVASMLVFQIAINVGMCVGSFPVIGLTLPFISYGGSSIVTMFIAMGLISGIHMRPSPDSENHYITPKY